MSEINNMLNNIVIKEINADIGEVKARGGETDNISDGYHSFGELYEFRKVYNALLFNEWHKHKFCNVYKAKRHHDGEPCFGVDDKWFIVVAELPTGQISNHYKVADWDLFKIPVYDISPVEYDGHSPQMALERMKETIKEYTDLETLENVNTVLVDVSTVLVDACIEK